MAKTINEEDQKDELNLVWLC